MFIKSLKSYTTQPLALAGVIFLCVNIWTSYAFYHVNSYKLFLTAIGTSLLAIHLFFSPSTRESSTDWVKPLSLLFLPLLATFPGLIQHRISVNYNFEYELASNLIVIMWAFCVFAGARKIKDIDPLLFFIGITLIYTGLWAILEKTGYHPFNWNAVSASRVKSTFGNINYFSGFLIITLPLAFVHGIPSLITNENNAGKRKIYISTSNIFFIIAFVFGVTSLFLAQTRAAIAGWGVSMLLVTYLYAVILAPQIWRKRLLRFLIGAMIAGGVILLFLALFNESFQSSRFAALFSIQAWYSRISPWQTAIESILSSPLVGYGLGSSYNLYFRFVDPSARLYSSEHSYNHVHSEPIEYMQESGLLGLVVYILFWGLIFYTLIRAFRLSGNDEKISKLVIGILGGILAYHFQGTFSVAPRMMVVKFPLYTMIGLAFALYQITSAKADSVKRSLRFRKSIFIVPVGLGVLVIWILLIPWLTGQYSFVQIMNQPNSIRKVNALETLVKNRQDVYALDYLAKLEVDYRRPNELSQTIEQIEALIPHYRDVNLIKAMHALLSNQPEQAKLIAIEAQKRDMYHLPIIDFLMGLAASTNDIIEFDNQFKRLTKIQAFNHKLIPSEEPFINQFREFIRTKLFRQPPVKLLTDDDILKVQILNLSQPVEFEEWNNQLTIKWDARLIALLFKTARQNRISKQFSEQQKLQFWSRLTHTLARQPYFNLEIYDRSNPKAVEEIDRNVKKYFELKKELEMEQRRQRNAFITKINRSNRDQYKRIQNEHDRNSKAISQRFEKSISPLVTDLEQKSDWETFMNRQAFLTGVIEKTIQTVFPKSFEKKDSR